MRTRREFLTTSAAVLAGGIDAIGRDAIGQARTGDGQETRDKRPDPGKMEAGPHDRTGQLKLRGLLVGAGRTPESLEYYRRVIEFWADWGLNVLHFRLADDQGSARRLPSHPDLVTRRNAFTPEQMKDLVAYGRDHGVELIPELESFGHTGYITPRKALPTLQALYP